MVTRASRTSWIIAMMLLGLLGALGTLQYRWLSQVADAERERTLGRMQSAASRFAMDFDREVARALMTFGPPGSGGRGEVDLAERSRRWHREALVPDVVRAVFIARSDDRAHRGLWRFDADTGRLTATQWPDDLRDLRTRFEELQVSAGKVAGAPPADRLFLLAADVPALVVPRDPPGTPESQFTVIWLSRQNIVEKLLPALTARHFGGARGVEYHVEVTTAADPPGLVFRAGPDLAKGRASDPEVVVGLFALLLPDELRGADAPPRSLSRPQWRLHVADPSRAMDAIVARTQGWNLAVGFGVLLLLALTIAMMFVTTYRYRRLAEQQFAFVTGVTHELRTPLAAMRSAAQNLAHGVVRDPQQVMTYGRLIDQETRRLADMVEQVLDFAGMASGRMALDRVPVAMETVIDEALAECRPALDEKGIRVETEYSALPPVIGDARALRHAIVNLLTNAMKYGAGDKWIGVSARCVAGPPPRVEVAVADRGDGIAAVDLPHIFEPFYRGRGRSAASVPGSGLGLTLVAKIAEAHGGRVSVHSHASKGTTFTLHLPATA